MSKTTRKKKEQEITLTVFSNTPRDEAAYQTLQLFYKGAIVNEIAMMRALNNDTGEEELLLVGMQLTPDGKIDTYPLARVLDASEVSRYFSPDGKGGWYDAAAIPDPEPMNHEIN